MFDHRDDLCLSFFAQFWDEGLLPALPTGAKVLELGCGEADWLESMRKARPDVLLVGVDWRPVERKAADVLIHGDFLAFNFAPASFDAIVACSVVHWCGVGHYTDPKHADGDILLMERARLWVKPTGWMYFDLAYGTNKKRGIPIRTYDDSDIRERLLRNLWKIEAQRHFVGSMGDNKPHQDGPYVAQVVVPA